jgi:hypothetical protein
VMKQAAEAARIVSLTGLRMAVAAVVRLVPLPRHVSMLPA